MDFLNTIGNGETVPVALGVKNDVVLLQLDEGTSFTFFSSPVDNVDNRAPLQVAMEGLTMLNFPIMLASCPNSCSGSGNCTVYGDCICNDGFYGSDCSQGKSVLLPLTVYNLFRKHVSFPQLILIVPIQWHVSL